MLVIRHVSGADNNIDIFTKNTIPAIYKKHMKRFVRDDKYLIAEP